MRKAFPIVSVLLIGYLIGCSNSPKTKLARTPPMGWNSWNCFGVDITESEYKENVDFMAEHLKEYGWEYAVVDLGWYITPDLDTWTFKIDNPPQEIDEYGRLLPDPAKFPSSADGKGFKALGDYVHERGLKFGIHIMRGIPWQAVENNTPIWGTEFFARDIAAVEDTCIWYDGMLGVDMEHPGGQAYYNSLLDLYASWGVDYIKADDMSRPYHAADIQGLHKAIEKCGRPIVLSLSPGATPIDQVKHLRENANLWRISPDFWDDWHFLFKQFELSRLWQGKAIPGHWPDADMLPLGKLRTTGPDDYVCETMKLTREECTNEYSRFTDDEKRTLMTLWCIARSPLMFGGHLPETDAYTLSLISKNAVLHVNQASTNNREVFRDDPKIVWAADLPDSGDRVVALFNMSDSDSIIVGITWKDIYIQGQFAIRDLWTDTEMGRFDQGFEVKLPPHGGGLYRLTGSD